MAEAVGKLCVSWKEGRRPHSPKGLFSCTCAHRVKSRRSGILSLPPPATTTTIDDGKKRLTDSPLISFLFLLLFPGQQIPLTPPQSYCCTQWYRRKNVSFTRNNRKVREACLAFVSWTGNQVQGLSRRPSSQVFNPLLRNESKFCQHVFLSSGRCSKAFPFLIREEGKDCTRTANSRAFGTQAISMTEWDR